MESKPTIRIKEIAEMLDLSPSTVSMVLNNKGRKYRISESTSERIIQAATELGYEHPVRKKRKTRSLSKSIVSIFCPTNFERGPSFYAGIYEYFKETNLEYETLIFPFERGKLKEKATYISKDFAAGAIMIALSDEDIMFIENTMFDIPIVLFNRTAKGYSSVLTDDYAVGYNAMEHFIKRGHTQFGIVSPDYSSRALSLRTTGFWDKFKSHDFGTDAAYIAPICYAKESDAGGYAAMKEMLNGEKIPSAVLVPNDNMVIGVIRCITEEGFEIPKDIEIISFGDKPTSSIISPTVTSFVPPTDDMSYNCAKLLHRFIEEGIMTDNVKLSYEASCIFRESCPE